MNLVQTTAVIIRLYAIWYLTNILWVIWSMSNQIIPASANKFSEKIEVLLLYVAFISIALIVIKFPVSVAKRIVPSSVIAPPETDADFESLKVVGSITLGLYFLASSIPVIVKYGITIMLNFNANSESIRQLLLSELGYVVQSVIGLCLVFGARRLVKLIREIGS